MISCGKPDRDEEAACGAGDEVEGSVVGADDAPHDGQAEPDARVLVGAYAFRTALKGLGQGR